MAITYDGAGGIFTDAGKIIGGAQAVEDYLEDSLDAGLLEIITAFDDSTMTHIEGLKAAFDDYRDAGVAWRKAIAERITSRVLDPAKIINELHLPTTSDLDIVLPRFREKMAADSETVQKNTVTLGSVTAGANNVGNGTIIATKILDGWSDPGDFFPADQGYNGLDSELCAESETITVECTADSQTSGLEEGAETFKAYGNPPNPEDSTPTPYFGIGTEGSGSSVDAFLYAAHSGTIVTTPGFDYWNTDTPPLPDPWTVDNGTNDNHVKKESTNYYRGGYAIQFLGDGAQATISIGQFIDPSLLKPRRRYLVSIRYKADASISAGDLGVEFSGTGYSPGSDKISIAHGSLATSWTLATFQINMPTVIPTDWKLVVKVTGTLTSAKKIYVDDVYITPMKYFGGVGIAVVPGSTRFCKGDRFSFTVTNDRAGKFQSMWCRFFGRQLPSASSSPTISETLADSAAFVPEAPAP